MNNYYLYQHIRLDRNQVFYIGDVKNLKVLDYKDTNGFKQ